MPSKPRAEKWFEIEVPGVGVRPMRQIIKALTATDARKKAFERYPEATSITVIGKAEQRLLQLNRSTDRYPQDRSITASHMSPEFKPSKLQGRTAFSNIQTNF